MISRMSPYWKHAAFLYLQDDFLQKTIKNQSIFFFFIRFIKK